MNEPKLIRVGTRGSDLGLIQTEEVLSRLRQIHPTYQFKVETVQTKGDIRSEVPLSDLGRGIFVKEIENALIKGEIDMAVHSLKDMPTDSSEDLTIGAICSRGDSRDVLINRWKLGIAELPPKGRIGTSSPRRIAQIKVIRPDLDTIPIRGNVDTRLRKADGGDYDGVILAAAGILRLGLQAHVAEFLSPEQFVPAPGQGALAVEVRQDDHHLLGLLVDIDHGPSRVAVTTERAFLQSLGGGCQTPLGAYAKVDGNMVTLTVFVASSEDSLAFTTRVRGHCDNPHQIAMDARQKLKDKGAGQLLH